MVHVEKQRPLTLKGIKAKQWIDRVGGVGSILTGILCAVIGWGDREAQRSIWQVWAFMFLLLVTNGIAMLIHANRVGKKIAGV
jgi:NAD(P)H-hydrate repair Nnr-like enzyme with NAD(P)H-hydrate dehydratase domain